MDRESIRNKLNSAWTSFDTGDLEASRTLYIECLQELSDDEHDLYTAALMGLIYVESSAGNFKKAREYANALLNNARGNNETHIFLHQSGMVERMAGRYTESLDFFLRERKLLLDTLSDDHAGISANFYETGYIQMNQALYTEAEQDLKHSLKAACDSGDMECIGCAYRGLGELYAKTGIHDLSCEMYQKAIEAFAKADDLFAIKEVEHLLGQTH